MPMGDPRTFYDYYLEMLYQGAKNDTMQRLMAEAGVTEAYLVLNDYWDNSQGILAQASQSAAEIFEIDNGKVYIFRYLID